MKVVLLDEAQRRFEAEDRWWRENRDAKDSSAPGLGQRYRRARGKLIQRVPMKKTRCHVYYLHDSDRDLVEIHSIWGARRGRGPAL